jgi:hypothetical protein
MIRRLGFVSALVGLGLGLGGCTGAPPAGLSPIPSGIYDSDPCTNQTACQARLNQIRTDGFDVVLNYATEGMDNATRASYADDANAAKLKVVWSMGQTVDVGGLPSYFATVDSKPATAGYYLWDEPTKYDLNDVNVRKHYYMASGTTKPCLIVTRFKWQSRYATTCQYVGPDDYPYGSPFNDPPVDVGAASAAQAAAGQGTQHLPFVLQAFSWSNQTCDPRWWNGSYRFPTRNEMRTDRDNAMLAASSKGKTIDVMFWFSYSCITASDAPPGFEADVAWAANNVTLTSPPFR